VGRRNLKKAASLFTSIILVLAIFTVVDLVFNILPRAGAGTIYVDDSNPGPGDGSAGNPFKTIQDGVDAAQPGDTVYVYSGTYYENVVVNKTINLTGEDRNTTIIKGIAEQESIVLISADWVNITGFTTSRGGPPSDFAGIELSYVWYCRVFNNNASCNQIGIYLSYSFENTLTDNIIRSNYEAGVFLTSSSYNTISGNTLKDNSIGLSWSYWNNITSNILNSSLLDFYDSSYNNITGNTLFNEEIYICFGSQNNIVGNTISTNFPYGIHIKSSSGNNITGNNISTNDGYGIFLDYSSNNIITGNTALDNDFGIFLYYSSGNNIIDNNAANNTLGIRLHYGKSNNITNNTVSLNNYNGIALTYSRGNNVTNNTMIDNGIFIYGDSLKYWNTHNIETSNTVNGKPVYYWKNQTGGIVPLGAGQVILANCTNISIENQELTNGSVGIELGFSSNNNITSNNVSSNNRHGIYLYFTSENTITDNTISSNKYNGVTLYSSVNNVLVNCSISNSSDYDLYFDSNSHVTSINTTFEKTKTYFEDIDSTLTVKWYLHVNVKDLLGNPVPNAKVKIEDNKKGSYNETYTTDGNGHLWWIPVTEYIAKKSSVTYHTPHRITAWNDTLVGYAYPDPNIDHSQYVDIVLRNGTMVNLENGWNLISLPRIPSNSSLEMIIQSIENRYDSIWLYNITDVYDPWKHYHVLMPSNLNDLWELNHTMGFWLHVTDPEGAALAVFGYELIANQSILLYPGWNLVGYPSTMNRTRDEALNNLEFGPDIYKIQTYNATTQKWVELDDSMDYFEVGRGYWVYSTVRKIWDVPL
jgi:parallel beta-helix repeat protein